MKHLYFLTFLFLTSIVSAQSDSSKMEWGFSFYNEWCDRILSVEDTYETIGEELDSLEKGAYGFSAGIVLGRKLNSNWTVYSGLNYSSRGFNIDSIQNSNSFNFRSRFHFIEVPLSISKEFGSGTKARPFVKGGVLFSYLTQHKNTWQQVGGTATYDSSDLDELNRFQLNALLSVGVEFSIYKNWKISIDGRLRQSIQPISDTPWKRYLNGAGVGILLKKEF